MVHPSAFCPKTVYSAHLAEQEPYMLFVLQYVELAFNAYERYYIYSIILMMITVLSGIWAVKAQYKKRLNLYNTVQQKRVMPIVLAGTVRYTNRIHLVYAPPVHSSEHACHDC